MIATTKHRIFELWEQYKLYRRVPLYNRFCYFISDHHYIKIAFYAIAILTIIVGFIYIGPSLQTILPVFKDSGFAGLFGVLIGGIVAAIASYDVARWDKWANALISKSETIYEPLYNEIKRFRDHLDKSPYDSLFYFDTYFDDQDSNSFPLWRQIKSDTRHLDMPQWFAELINEMERTAEKYLEIKKQAFDDAEPAFRSCLDGKFQTAFPEGDIYGILQSYVPSNYLVHYLSNGKSGYNAKGILFVRLHEANLLPITDSEQQELLWSSITARFDTLPSVQEMIRSYIRLIVLCDFIMRQLANLIRYIKAECKMQRGNF
jgi:hypothetical protein